MGSSSFEVESVLLLAVDDTLFKACFGADDLWPCQLETLPESCSKQDLDAKLTQPGLGCVVIQSSDAPHWATLKKYYEDGGFLVFFGIYGEFGTPSWLSKQLGLRWRFSAYTKYEYVLTDAGKRLLGTAVTEQQYTKANLLAVPDDDKVLAPKVPSSLEAYLSDEGYSSDEVLDEKEVADARAGYDRLKRDLAAQVPLAMHENKNGGRIAYLGFVNGDGNIPKFVRALCCRKQVQA